MSNWDKVFKPIVVLCIICVVITGALAATNSVTAPIIKEAIIKAQNEARNELLPEANGAFSPVEGVSVKNVSDVYAADNGAGYVITSSAKGYGGTMTVMTAFTPDGAIKQLKVTEAEETQGIGSNVANKADYWAKYTGLDGTKELVLNQDVDAYAGATISSRALNSAVNAAINAYNAIP